MPTKTNAQPKKAAAKKPSIGKVQFVTAHAKARHLEDLMAATKMTEKAIRERERTYRKAGVPLLPLYKRSFAGATQDEPWDVVRAAYLKLKPEAGKGKGQTMKSTPKAKGSSKAGATSST